MLRVLAAGASPHVRAVIGEDGEVKDGRGRTLGFIEPNGEAGDANLTYAGQAHLGTCLVTDADDVVIGEFDAGRGFVRDTQGSVVAEVTRNGSRVTNNAMMTVGSIDGFGFGHMATVAAYLLLLDRAYLAPAGGQ